MFLLLLGFDLVFFFGKPLVLGYRRFFSSFLATFLYFVVKTVSMGSFIFRSLPKPLLMGFSKMIVVNGSSSEFKGGLLLFSGKIVCSGLCETFSYFFAIFLCFILKIASMDSFIFRSLSKPLLVGCLKLIIINSSSFEF